MCSATASMPCNASDVNYSLVYYLFNNNNNNNNNKNNNNYITQQTNQPLKWACSSLDCSVKSLSCLRSSGYLRILWMGFMRYDSRATECCCIGLWDLRKSCSGMLLSGRGDRPVNLRTKKWVVNEFSHNLIEESSEPLSDWHRRSCRAWSDGHNTRKHCPEQEGFSERESFFIRMQITSAVICFFGLLHERCKQP